MFNNVLVTGSSGTIGQSLVQSLLKIYPNCEVTCFDNNESQLFFQEQDYIHDDRVKLFLGDIRDIERVRDVMYGIDLVFHLAAYKHVVMCERSPIDATQTNINGLYNIIKAANEFNVKKVIFTSSDKAVNPTNVMGTSKLMGERLITAANTSCRRGDTIFSSTRFGNVLGSTGSVVPIFRKQIEAGGPVTITDPDMTRFVMSVDQAVSLVMDSAIIAKGGEVFVTKMPVVRILDLAEVMINELAPRYGHLVKRIEIKQIGHKPGEKMYEELMSEEEMNRAMELQSYFSIIPAFKGLYHSIDYDYDDIISSDLHNPYNSRDEMPLNKKDICQFLNNYDLI
jgi:FlaA1/EpsC-like NDP-sugar epimerase